MASFRGIGDAATQVIQDQNRLGMQAAGLSEQARQFDVSVEERRKAREQQAAQFNAAQQAEAARAGAQMAEQSRQFDTGMAQRERTLAEQQRQFNVGQGLEQAKFARQQGIDDFRMGLESLTASADLAGKDADTRMRLAQLGQYVAATADEERKRKNREQMAKGAFGSLAVAALMNGGVMPVSALEIANKELGDKDNRIVGGGVDPESGVAFFNIQSADGTAKQLKMSPENQFALLQNTYGDEVAGIFANKYKQNATVSAALERAKIQAQTKAEAAQTAFYDKRADTLEERLAKLEATPPVGPEATKTIENLRKEAAEMRRLSNEAHGLKGPAAETPPQDKMAAFVEPGSRKMTESARQRYNLPPDTEVRLDPKSGRVFAAYKRNGQWVPYYLTD